MENVLAEKKKLVVLKWWILDSGVLGDNIDTWNALIDPGTEVFWVGDHWLTEEGTSAVGLLNGTIRLVAKPNTKNEYLSRYVLGWADMANGLKIPLVSADGSALRLHIYPAVTEEMEVDNQGNHRKGKGSATGFGVTEEMRNNTYAYNNWMEFLDYNPQAEIWSYTMLS